MALAIHILVGTMTGTAQLVAQELELAFADDELRAALKPELVTLFSHSVGQLFAECRHDIPIVLVHVLFPPKRALPAQAITPLR